MIIKSNYFEDINNKYKIFKKRRNRSKKKERIIY